MGVQFCEDCGYLLPVTAAEEILCDLCGRVARVCLTISSLQFFSSVLIEEKDAMLTSVQVSSSTNFPSRLRTKLRSQTQTVTQKDIGDGPVTEIECPRCSNKKATWSEAQLRSADEGSTIFYCCMQCRHRYL